MFRKNILFGRIIRSKVQNLTVFSIIYMIRIRFFGPGELIQKYFSAPQFFFCFADDSHQRDARHFRSPVMTEEPQWLRVKFVLHCST